jgi:shikimate kinase
MRNSRRPVFLVGFMGAGKSTAGAALARLIGWEFLDLDDLIVAEDGRTILRIFEESGEAYFRGLERRLISGLRDRERIVVACGGGTYVPEASRALIDAIGRAVWIEVPLEEAIARCGGGPARPLLRDRSQAEALYRSRLPAYRLAPIRVDGAGLGPGDVAERIAGRL